LQPLCFPVQESRTLPTLTLSLHDALPIFALSGRQRFNGQTVSFSGRSRAGENRGSRNGPEPVVRLELSRPSGVSNRRGSDWSAAGGGPAHTRNSVRIPDTSSSPNAP